MMNSGFGSGFGHDVVVPRFFARFFFDWVCEEVDFFDIGLERVYLPVFVFWIVEDQQEVHGLLIYDIDCVYAVFRMLRTMQLHSAVRNALHQINQLVLNNDVYFGDCNPCNGIESLKRERSHLRRVEIPRFQAREPQSSTHA